MLCLDTDNRVFTLHTAHTTYQMAVDEDGCLRHLYYGARTAAVLPIALTRHAGPESRVDRQLQEYPCPGMGDNRMPFFQPEFADGTEAAALTFVQAEALPGKYALPGLPAFRDGADGGGETLRLTLRDAAGLTVTLLYGVFEDCDLITRAAILENTGSAPLTLHGVPSAAVDFAPAPLDLITLDGTWGTERTPHRAAVRPGVQSVGSVAGISSHYHNPFAVLCRPDAAQEQGGCWGFALVYSGNFRIQVEQSIGGTRLTLGIEPYHFHWTLAPGERFVTPEAAMVYSGGGLGGMSRCFHRAIRRHLLRAPWCDSGTPRPVLLNSWEACYFDFDEERLVRLAGAAKAAGADLFVLDDGWFGRRDDDTRSLGDWYADTRKLPGGIPALCRRVNALGLELGIWVEPEAVNPDSDLFRAHPDWAFRIDGRPTYEMRHQYTLDLSRGEVRRGILAQLFALLDSAPIRYVKWDMNRTLANVYSAALPARRQGEVYHRYVLGLYEMQQALVERYPALLLENCASGGARFDCGMLFYSPQIWTSDNTDALARLMIQYGSSLCYPACTMGAHVSVCPNHQTGRTASLAARMAAALSGTFGFELDLTRYSAAALQELHPYVDFYRAHGAVLRGGDLYWLRVPDGHGALWAFAAPDGSEMVVLGAGAALDGSPQPLPFADADAVYESGDGARYSGALLAAGGLPIPWAHGHDGAARPESAGDLPGFLCYLKRL